MKLDGVRVLDLTRFLPGPWVGLALADHGAEVIKVESPEGEPSRRIGPAIEGFTAYFRNTQRGKKSLVLDLKQPEGRDIFLALAREADVVLESFRPGVADRLGIGYDTLKALNPRLVYCALTAFGQTGAYAQRPTHDAGAQALMGMMSLSHPKPVLPTLPTCDIALGSIGLAAVAMALYGREKSGRGDFIDLAMTDALLSWAPHELGTPLAHGRAPDVASDRLHGGSALYNVYETKDGGHVVLAGAERHFAENLMNALGRPDLVEACTQPPGEAQEPARRFLREVFLTRTRDEWDAFLAQAGVCYGPVLDLKEAWDLPYLRERRMVVLGDDGVEFVGTPIKYREEPGQPSCAPPGLGEHSEEILARLGYDAAARQRLKAAKVT